MNNSTINFTSLIFLPGEPRGKPEQVVDLLGQPGQGGCGCEQAAGQDQDDVQLGVNNNLFDLDRLNQQKVTRPVC